MFALPDALHLGVLSSRVHVAWALAAGGTLEDRPRYNKSLCFESFPFPDLDTGLTPALAENIRQLAEQIDSHRKARQVVHDDLTLTALYNVLEKLRSKAPLTSKEKVIHGQGLVGVLGSLHDELDSAVLQAYGWDDLQLPADTDTLLERLVALNTRRTAEEVAGTIRWLRPEFQRVQSQGDQIVIEVSTESGPDEEIGGANPFKSKVITTRPWPSGLTEQIKAVAEVLAQSGASFDRDELAAHFSGRGRWRDRLPTLLDTLAALGRARVSADGKWTDAGR